ncbi:glycosyltransferase [Patescibacteria group bacterium]|nr:glycosyltransferase [Patescibacteria group bacterium]
MEIKTRKKVLYLITKSNWGGAQRYVYDLATTLDTEQFEPVVALGGNGTLVTMLDNAGIRTIPLYAMQNSMHPARTLAATKELYRLLKTEKPDIFHVNSSLAGLVGTIAGRLARVPKIIFTAHGWAFNEDRSSAQKYIIKIAHWLTVLLSHRTIAVSNGLLKEMRWPGAWAKMKVINPGRTIGAMYERDEAREKIADFYAFLRPHLSDPWVVCLAELHPIKRHTILFSAFAEVVKTHPTARLICIGDGSLRDKLAAQIEKDNLSEHVFLLGSLTEAARFLKAFDLLTLASKSESYGYVLHEAGLARVPVVATNVGGIPNIVDHKESGLLVPPDDVAALALDIIHLLRHPDEATRYADTLKIKMQYRSVEHMTRTTEYLYVS